jgi:hypothetical protein
MLRWLFLCYQSHALLVIHMLPLCHAPLLIQIDATTMSCSLGHLQLPMFHVTSLSIHMLHQWVFTCYIEYSHVVIKLCFFGYSYATWVMFHLSFSWYQWHTSLVIQMQQLCHAYSHAANMQSLLVSYMRCYCDNMI